MTSDTGGLNVSAAALSALAASQERPATRAVWTRSAAGRNRTEVNALDTPATYLNWNFILISVPNLVVIIGMLVVFGIALFAPFPGHAEVVESEDGRDD